MGLTSGNMIFDEMGANWDSGRAFEENILILPALFLSAT